MCQDDDSPAAVPEQKTDQGPAGFEQSLGRLEQIVALLEEGGRGLDESLKLFEEGVQRYRACNEKLLQVETKIGKLVQTLEGELQREPFELPEP